MKKCSFIMVIIILISICSTSFAGINTRTDKDINHFIGTWYGKSRDASYVINIASSDYIGINLNSDSDYYFAIVIVNRNNAYHTFDYGVYYLTYDKDSDSLFLTFAYDVEQTKNKYTQYQGASYKLKYNDGTISLYDVFNDNSHICSLKRVE